MNVPQFISADDLWPTLKKLSRQSSGVRIAVSAYIGAGASKMLPLRRVDILLCEHVQELGASIGQDPSDRIPGEREKR